VALPPTIHQFHIQPPTQTNATFVLFGTKQTADGLMGDGAAKLVNGCGVVGFLMVLVCFV
jgi:hypothetical protein